MIKQFFRVCQILLVLALTPGVCRAETKFAAGRVYDSFTRELLKGVQIDVLSKGDSSLISTVFTDEPGFSFNMPSNISIDIPQEGAILYLRKDGYYPKFYTTPRVGSSEWGIELQPIMLDRVPFYKPKELDELTVTASRVKMVVRGDTITYNADAFTLPQGSMLDGLIDQLPGAELKSDGKIFVNGKFVDELLVNGDNLFKGDPKITLENLPAYMVSNISVYHRNEMMERKPLDQLPLVMDVKLKKQYQTGWIANAEAGYGTADRFVGRLFALMFTRDSRLSVVGNFNNTNDDRKPGQTDNWNPNWQSAGRATIASGGLDYLWNSRMRNWKVEANILAEHKKSLIESTGNSERYLVGGNISGFSRSTQRGRQWQITSDNRVTFHVPRLWVYLKPSVRYVRLKSRTASESSDEDASGTLMNSLTESEGVYQRQWTAGTDLDGRWSLPASSRNLTFSVGIKWDNSRYETSISRTLRFPQEPQRDEESLPQQFMPERKFGTNVSIGCDLVNYKNRFINGSITAKYFFSHDRIHSTRDYFLRQPSSADALPSAAEAMRHAILVPSKSYDYTIRDDRHTLRLSTINFLPHLKGQRYQPNISLAVNFKYVPGNIRYRRADREYYAQRRDWYAEPEISVGIDDAFSFSYKYNASLPDWLYLLDVADDANPLFIYLGNPDIKKSRVHELWLYVYRLFPRGPQLEVTYRKYENLIAQSASYNMLNGITTYKPVNINGNWDITGNLRYNRSFGASRKWRVESVTRAMFQNSVDMNDLAESTVRNLSLSENLKLTCRITDGMELTANGNAEWRKTTSPMPDFNPLSVLDFDYGFIYRASKLPWNMSFTTDLMMHSRRGYSDARLNTNDLVWNARLSKSILRGNLIFALDGFDILGNLSNVRLIMNSQGRIETHYNSLPRYAMLHVIYRLNFKPKSGSN